MGNLNNKGRSGFQSLLYVNFIFKKKYRVDDTAQKMGIHKDTLYKWVRGENPFPIDQLTNLVKATGDLDFLEYFCEPCGYSLIPKIKDKGTAKMFSQMARIMQSAIDLEE